MSRFTKVSLYYLSLLLILAGCQKKAFDEYYERPDGLADPIYKTLQAKQNFTNFLACIDKSGYKEVLAEGGYWTMFAPNDAAFAKFFQEKGISGVDKIDTAMARGIVTYCLAYNSYRKDQLSVFQTDKGPVPNLAFRRKTAYYDFVYTDPNHSGKVVGSNRNGSGYVANDNNNKYIPYFLDAYLSAKGISSADYAALYPGSTYSGFNVADANVVTADIAAENGTIHEIDRVIQPLQNVEQYVGSNPNYSEFKALLNQLASYQSNAALTQRYKVLTGKSDSVFVKSYPPALAFSPANESHLNVFATDGQAASWSIAVPTNQALKDYVKSLLVNYGTFQAAPPSVLTDLVNSFMYRTAVWPKDLIGAGNAQLELPTFSSSNIVERKLLSNGLFYGTNKVQEANVFRTVYGKPYLDPKYTLMTKIIDASDLKVTMNTPVTKFTVFMASNTELNKYGYDFSSDRNSWSYLAPVIPAIAIDYGATPLARLSRIIQSSVLYTPRGEFDNITTGEGVAESYNGEYIKFKNNKVYASGNVVNELSGNTNAFKSNFVTVDSVKNTVNGKVYYTKGLLEFAENTETLGLSISRLAGSSDPNIKNKFNSFFQFLSKSPLFTPGTMDIAGVQTGTFYTALIPTDVAISNAVKAGLLPATGAASAGVPNYAPTTSADIAKVTNFILYHIIDKSSVAADGNKTGSFPTLLKNAAGDARTLDAFYPGSNPAAFVGSQLEFRDNFYNGTATPPVLGASINYSFSNQLANRALIHSINKVLDYR